MRFLKRHFELICFIVIVTLFSLIVGTATVYGDDVILYPCQPDDSLAVWALVEEFDSEDVVWRYDPVLIIQPAFVNYAISASKLDGAGPILTEVLAGVSPDGLPYSWQERVAAGCGLEAMGSEAIVAEPVLREMLESDVRGEIVLALGIVRGIGPGAASLLEPVRAHLAASSFHTRYWACRALGAIGWRASDATADLCDLLRSDQPASVRRNACAALGRVAGCSPDLDRACFLLIHVAMNDQCQPVRVEAEAALEALVGDSLEPDPRVPTPAKV